MPAEVCHATTPRIGRAASGTEAPSFIRILPNAVRPIIRTKPSTIRISGARIRLARVRRRLGADRRPRHLIDPAELYIGEAGGGEQRLHRRARPVMRDLWQHLVEDDRAYMRESQPPQQLEIGDTSHPQP